MRYKYIENFEDIYKDYIDVSILQSSKMKFIPDDHTDIEVRYDISKNNEDDFNYEGLEEILNGQIQNGNVSSDTDFQLAVLVHRYFVNNGMVRKFAGNIDIWHYMSIIHLKSYITARWGELDNKPAAINRYFGRMGRNAISRLWLWADLTFDPKSSDPYHLTKYRFNQNVLNFALETDMPLNRELFKTICYFIRDNIQGNGKISDYEGAIKNLFPKIRMLNTTRKLTICTKDETEHYFLSFIRQFEK